MWDDNIVEASFTPGTGMRDDARGERGAWAASMGRGMRETARGGMVAVAFRDEEMAEAR